MALSILSSRVVPVARPMRLVVNSSLSMSSTPATSDNKGNKIVKKDTSGVKKKESLKSKLSFLWGGTVDPADPNAPGIPVQKANFPNIVEHATGEEKLYLLAFENGFLDPYCNLPVTRDGRGTKDNPVLVESFTDERLIGCVCEISQTYTRYTHLYADEPKRCACGHWMKLVPAPKFWEKIPKEDLLTIPYFADLEEEGKLDDLLAGKDISDDHGKHHH